MGAVIHQWEEPQLQQHIQLPGPWQHEPDGVYWRDPHHDIHCLVRRGPLGALCGYVGVPPGHPWHGGDYDSVPASAHGGLTFSGMFEDLILAEHVPDSVWWVGFDCGHMHDLVPGMLQHQKEYNFTGSATGTYRDLEYVMNEVAQLAEEAAAGAPLQAQEE